MRYPANVPKLKENPSARFMHRSRDLAPRGDMLGKIDAGSSDISLADPRYLRRLADDQPRQASLRVIERGKPAGRPVHKRPIARKGSHENPVGGLKWSDLDRIKQADH